MVKLIGKIKTPSSGLHTVSGFYYMAGIIMFSLGYLCVKSIHSKISVFDIGMTVLSSIVMFVLSFVSGWLGLRAKKYIEEIVIDGSYFILINSFKNKIVINKCKVKFVSQEYTPCFCKMKNETLSEKEFIIKTLDNNVFIISNKLSNYKDIRKFLIDSWEENNDV